MATEFHYHWIFLKKISHPFLPVEKDTFFIITKTIVIKHIISFRLNKAAIISIWIYSITKCENIPVEMTFLTFNVQTVLFAVWGHSVEWRTTVEVLSSLNDTAGKERAEKSFRQVDIISNPHPLSIISYTLVHTACSFRRDLNSTWNVKESHISEE